MFRLSVKQKLKIVDEAITIGNIRSTARKYKVQLSQIHRWRKNYEEIKSAIAVSPTKMTVHSGPKITYPELEQQVYDWVTERRDDEQAISTSDIIDKAVSIDPSFCDGDERKLFYWVYRFMHRMNLSAQTGTRVS